MAEQTVTSHINAVVLCRQGKLRIDCQGRESVLGAGVVDQGCDLSEIR
jgi:hypothetical protein